MHINLSMVSLLTGLVIALATLLGFAAVFFVFRGAWIKGSLDVYNSNAAAQARTITDQQGRLSVLEHRFNTAESDKALLRMKLDAALSENEAHERILFIFIREKSALTTTARTEIEGILTSIQQKRAQSQQAIFEWQSTQAILNAAGSAPTA